MRPAADLLGGVRVLLACPDAAFRRRAAKSLQEELGLSVEIAEDGGAALEMVQNRSYRLLVADTSLSGILWFDLVQFLRELRPDTRYALLTSTPPEEHFRLALEYDVGAILPRAGTRPLRDLVETAESLLTENVFGLERWLGSHPEVHGRQIGNAAEIDQVVAEVAEWFPEGDARRAFRRALAEMVTNAVFYGALQEDGSSKADWNLDAPLNRDQAVYVFFGRGDDASGCAVVDRGGRLTKAQILSWLESNRVQGAQGILANDQIHGRGLHITRRSLDRIVLNIRANDRTEAILLRDTGAQRSPQRPLLIHEF
jgi:CheY-like chemotaxis protein